MLEIDREKCIKCGACADVCLYGTIRMTADGPSEKNEVCMKCGHCVAYCPTGAISNLNAPKADMTPYEKSLEISPEQAAQFLTSLRSERNYQDRPVEREKIEQILNVARRAFSGGNSQGISYIALDNKEKLRQFKDLIVPSYTAALQKNPAASGYKALRDHAVIDGIDTILWDAPCLVLAKCDAYPVQVGRLNSLFALTYARLYAQTLGIGSCWAGAVEGAIFNKMPALRDLLELGEDFDKITAAVMFGYPKYTQQRIPDRNKLVLEWKS
jgi:nitroreductase/Pyruvate/2-oxoacid:ferredoxin oxidoreductase delta subunit